MYKYIYISISTDIVVIVFFVVVVRAASPESGIRSPEACERRM